MTRPQPIVVIGGGGFGRNVLDVVAAINDCASRHEAPIRVLGVLDDGEPDERLLRPYGVEHIGRVDDLFSMPSQVGYVIGIGAPQARAQIDRKFAADRMSPVLVHPSATTGAQVALGPGSVLCAGVRLASYVELGRHVHVNFNSAIGHDAVLDDHVTLSPMVAITGATHAFARAFFGTGANVNPRLTVGCDAVVGTGAAVVRDVRAGTTVVGVPAKER